MNCIVYVVEANITFLLGLDVMSNEGLLVDLGNDTIRHPTAQWSLPLKRLRGHIFLCWDANDILFTRKELQKMHLHLFHRSAQKLYNLVKRASPQDVTPDTRKMLEYIGKSCDICAEFAVKGLRFKVAMPEEELAFNQTLAMDLMYLDNLPILHIVDVATGFSNAAHLSGSSVEDVWGTFVLIWATVYPGYPNKLRVDSGSVFT